MATSKEYKSLSNSKVPLFKVVIGCDMHFYKLF